MVSTLKIYEDLRESLDEKAAQRIAHHLAAVYEDLQQTATRSDIAELRAAIRELAEAQKVTEVRVGELAKKLDELAEAQKVTEVRMGELAKKLDELAEAQKATEVAVRELVEQMRDVRREQREMRADVGAMSHAIGYRLEDEAGLALPRLLKRDHNIEVTGRLVRRHLPLKSGGHLEVNILGEARRAGKAIHIVGEGKSQLHRRDVERFLQRTIPLAQAELGEIQPVLVTYMTPEPGLEDYVRQRGIVLYYSYDFALPVPAGG
jgi:hypothetical protein